MKNEKIKEHKVKTLYQKPSLWPVQKKIPKIKRSSDRLAHGKIYSHHYLTRPKKFYLIERGPYNMKGKNSQ